MQTDLDLIMFYRAAKVSGIYHVIMIRRHVMVNGLKSEIHSINVTFHLTPLRSTWSGARLQAKVDR